jgi:hypothetical protein
MNMSWSKFGVDFTHVSVRNDVTFVHTLDHFLWGEGTDDAIIDAGVIHLVENESDHSPIFCNFVMPKVDPHVLDKSRQNKKSKPSWKQASTEEKSSYKLSLSEKLENVAKPESTHCRNPKCDVTEHRNESDNYMEDILNAITEAAFDSLPVTSAGGATGNDYKKKVPGWNEQVHPFRQNARFWHAIWVSAEKPLNCQLHFIMRRTKNIFHYQVKKCKKAELEIKKQKLLSAMLDP